MTIARNLVIASLLLTVVVPEDAPGQEADSTVAVVSALRGAASVTGARTPGATPLRLFAWLSAGSTIEVAPGSRVTVVFSSGARFELGEGAKAVTGTRDLASSVGPVRRLEAVPPFPRISPIADSARAGPRSGAVRIRGGELVNLYPDRGSATLAESTVLRFAPDPHASRYAVEVQTESGTRVLQVETQSPAVVVSAGILRPGARYYWQVRTLDKTGQVARGAAEFVTVSEKTARARAALKAALDAAGDATSLALAAEIDRSLGLHAEARAQLRAAVAKAPDDVALRRAYERQQLSPDRQPREE